MRQTDKEKAKMSKIIFNSVWTYQKPTEFGFKYRWYLPKFIYSMAMHDLKFIRNNDGIIYKQAGYKFLNPAKQIRRPNAKG